MQLNELLSQKFEDPDLMDWLADVEDFLLETHSNELSSKKKSEIESAIKKLRFHGNSTSLVKNNFDQLKAILKRMPTEDTDESSNLNTESIKDFEDLKLYLRSISALESGIEITDLQDLEQHSHALQSKYPEIDFITIFKAMKELRS